MATRWRLTHLLLSLDYIKTRTLKLSSTIFSSLYRPVFIFIQIFIFFSGLPNYIKYQYIQTRRRKTVNTANDNKTTANRGCRAVFFHIWRPNTTIMPIDLGKQEQLSDFYHCALLSCKIVDGPQQH